MIEKADANGLIKGLRHNLGQSIALGCNGCPDRQHCGGIYVSAPVFNCMDHCNCPDPSKCPVICPNNSSFAKRIHEIRGFGFDDIERRNPIALRPLPKFAHLLFTYPKVANAIDLPVAAIPLSKVFNRSGKSGIALTRVQVEERFKLRSNTPLILSGVELDRNIEKLWGVQQGRQELMAGIRALDPLIVTSPNYSVVLDAPRHDAMHSLKRIALAWSELQDAGVRVALHLNAVSDRDYMRVGEFLGIHTEIDAVSLEYETGAAGDEQGQYHIEQLDRLVQRLGRAPHLVFRGDSRWIPSLRQIFPNITVVNGVASIKTRKRQRAVVREAGRLGWEPFPTPLGASLDELLRHNLTEVGAWLKGKVEDERMPELPAEVRTATRRRQVRASEVNAETDDKSLQMTLL